MIQVYVCNTVVVVQIKNKLVCRYCQTWSDRILDLICIFYWPLAEPLPGVHGTLWFSETNG